MAATETRSPWQDIWSLDQLIDRRLRKPRIQGVTMVIDVGLGVSGLRDLLCLAGPHIDHWKFGFGTSALMPLPVLEQKLELLREHHILTYPGGTLLEAAIVQQHCRPYLTRAKELGFTAVEVSDGTIEMPGERRRRVIESARNLGLTAITEVGRKSPDRQPAAAELAIQALQDLEWGASWVIVEARESGRGIGIYDRAGEICTSLFDEIIRLLGGAAAQIIWEAPQRSQQADLIQRLGPNVSLGNIEPSQGLALEALRCGLRYETLAKVAEHWRATGIWNPAQVEMAPCGVSAERP
jgi:phosphosulfolactate synthase